MQEYTPNHPIATSLFGLIAAVSLVTGGLSSLPLVIVLLFTIFCDTPTVSKWVKTNLLDTLHLEDLVFFSVIIMTILCVGAIVNVNFCFGAFCCAMWLLPSIRQNVELIIRDEFNKTRDPFLHKARNFYMNCGRAVDACLSPFIGLFMLATWTNWIGIGFACLLFYVGYKEITSAIDRTREDLPYGEHTCMEDLKRLAKA